MDVAQFKDKTSIDSMYFQFLIPQFCGSIFVYNSAKSIFCLKTVIFMLYNRQDWTTRGANNIDELMKKKASGRKMY